MIAIINDGKNKSTRGVHGYRVQINDKVICTFEHLREDGLAECLRKAAAAVEDAEAAKSWYPMSLFNRVVEKG
jgi:hypothetical protein